MGDVSLPKCKALREKRGIGSAEDVEPRVRL